MMLVIVLCRFSVLIGKSFLKETQHESLYYLGRRWSTSLPVFVTAVIDSLCCRRLDSKEKLIKAMLQGSNYAMLLLAACLSRLVPGLKTENSVDFFLEEPKFKIIPLLGNKVSSRNRSQVNEDQNLLLGQQEALNQIATKVGGVA